MNSDIVAVRAAADIVLGRFGCHRADCRDCAKYVFATIPADATAPITAEWLREVWGWEEGGAYLYSRCGTWWACKSIRAWAIGQRGADIFAIIDTRHQFAAIFTALGIQPQPPKAKE